MPREGAIMKLTVLSTVAAGLMAVGAASADAAVLTFEDTTNGPVVDGCGGLSWEYLYRMDGSTSLDPDGYNNGIVSGKYIVRNGGINGQV